MGWIGRILLAVLAVIVLGAGGFLILAWEPAIALSEKVPDASSFDRGLKERGAALAAIGNCNVCHTTQGGKPYAGGRAIATPFGAIYAANITPDPETGIGRWSQAAFERAMRSGVDRQGRHLYPAFPYDHFTRLSDDDVKALYAFMMTREPVRAETPANDLAFPYSARLAVAGWKLLFFRRGRLQADRAHDAAWNRGAYLVDAVAHCGACHTPRNRLGAEETHQVFAGGSAEGWHAPALNAQSHAPVPWTADALTAYLQNGFDRLHGAAAGPMAPVVRNLAQVPTQDVQAIAAYIASAAGSPSPEQQQSVDRLMQRLSVLGRETMGLAAGGSARNPIFAGACAGCHVEVRGHGAGGAISLALGSAVNAPEPDNAIRVVLEGIHPAEGQPGPLMPGFAEALTDEQIAQVLAYVRASYSTRPAWFNLAARIRQIRRGKEPS